MLPSKEKAWFDCDNNGNESGDRSTPTTTPTTTTITEINVP